MAERKVIHDDDVVCLSSDDEEQKPVEVKPTPSKRTSRLKSPSLLDMGFTPIPLIQIPNSSISRGSTNSVNSAAIKNAPKSENVEFITLDDDEGDFEIEYAENTENARKVNIEEGDDDDDIQVLTDKGPQKQSKKFKFSHDPGGTQAVNLSVPGLNLGLITTANKSRPSYKLIKGVNDDPLLLSEESEENVKANGSVVNGLESVQVSLPAASNVNHQEESYKALNKFLNEFCARVKRVKKEKLEKARKKTLKAYDTIKHSPQSIHKRLKEDIEAAYEELRIQDNHWRLLANLINLMNPSSIAGLGNKTDDERLEAREREKQKLRIKFEKELAKIQNKIRKLEATEVDWDEDQEHNSAYILAEKYKERLIQHYYRLCDLSGCNHFTGRPSQTRINLKKHNAGSQYEAIDNAVEKFINKKGFMFAPDYTDILDIITQVNKSEELNHTEDEISTIALKMFENVMKIIRKRREKDFKTSMLAHLPMVKSSTAASTEEPESIPRPQNGVPDEEDEFLEERLQSDPAEMDAELKAKLEENELLKKSESEVILKFSRLQSESKTASSEMEGDMSPAPSDNEEDSDGDDDDSAESQNKHLKDELWEDEDEEAETITSGWTGQLSPGDDVEEEDENSNGDSESDTNAENTEEISTDAESAVTVAIDGGDCTSSETVENPGKRNFEEICTDVENVVTVSLNGVDGNKSVEKTNKRPIEECDLEEIARVESSESPPVKKIRPDENCNEDCNGKTEEVNLA